MTKDTIKTSTSYEHSEALSDSSQLSSPSFPKSSSAETFLLKAGLGQRQSGWRLEILFDSMPDEPLALIVHDDVILGIGPKPAGPAGFVNLLPFKGRELGVSRRHLLLRPTVSNLFAMDLGSTNGTRRNGSSIGVQTPASLQNHDLLSLGALNCTVRIIERPQGQTAELVRQQNSLSSALVEIAVAITSQLNTDDIMSQMVELAKSLTEAEEISLWLVNQASGELYLEAESGIDNPEISRMHLPVSDSLAGQVQRTGKSFRVSASDIGHRVKIKTGYFVDSLVYVPIKLGGITFGVLAAAHREPGKSFSQQHEELLNIIASFAAVALQNANVHEITATVLRDRKEELRAIKEVSQALSSSLELDAICHALLDQLSKYWPVETGSLWIREKETGLLKNPIDQSVFSESIFSKRQTASFLKVLELGELTIVPEVGEGDWTSHNNRFETTGKLASEVIIPVGHGGETIGFLHLQSHKGDRFTESDRLTLQTISDQLALVIENSYLYGTTRDIATELERRVKARTAELKIANEHLQVLNRMKQEFISNVSHELRTPLTSLKVYHHLLVERPEKARSYLEALQAETDRLAHLIDDILYIAELDEAPPSGQFSELDLNELIYQYLQDHPLQAETRQLTLQVETSVEEPIVSADREMLVQLLSILISNALNFTPAGGKITVSTKIAEKDGRDWAYLEVQDTGYGISPSEQIRIFERFFRGSATRQPNAPAGAGLGLSIALEIVDRHRGHIEVFSQGEPGMGTTVAVRLPTVELP